VGGGGGWGGGGGGGLVGGGGGGGWGGVVVFWVLCGVWVFWVLVDGDVVWVGFCVEGVGRGGGWGVCLSLIELTSRGNITANGNVGIIRAACGNADVLARERVMGRTTGRKRGTIRVLHKGL